MRRVWHLIFGHPYDDMEWVPEAGGYGCLSCREGMGGYHVTRVRPLND